MQLQYQPHDQGREGGKNEDGVTKSMPLLLVLGATYSMVG